MSVITIWGDESSQNGHRYMVLGTIWQKPECKGDLNKEVEQLRNQYNFHEKFHWTDLRRHHLPMCKDLLKIFKKYNDQNLLQYRSIVVDNSDKLHKIYSPDEELHFYKMYFWLIYKRLTSEHKYDIFLHKKHNKVKGRLSDLKNSLNSKYNSDNATTVNIVRRVEPRDGSQIELQLVDLFTGAIAYIRNGHYEKAKNNPKNPKIQMIQMIEEILSVNLSSSHTLKESENFNIWHFKRNRNVLKS